MPTSDITATPGKLDHASQDTSRKENNTTYCWNTSQEQRTEQTDFQDKKTTTQAATQKMKASLYGPSTTSVRSTQESAS